MNWEWNHLHLKLIGLCGITDKVGIRISESPEDGTHDKIDRPTFANQDCLVCLDYQEYTV